MATNSLQHIINTVNNSANTTYTQITAPRIAYIILLVPLILYRVLLIILIILLVLYYIPQILLIIYRILLYEIFYPFHLSTNLCYIYHRYQMISKTPDI